mmetsp:Transcript_19004/g.48518  ORF Transcript_19004/g.48518 Transcript_19004/m.48518 type:complete len:118 (+) Transcript_19004:123-476(+)
MSKCQDKCTREEIGQTSLPNYAALSRITSLCLSPLFLFFIFPYLSHPNSPLFRLHTNQTHPRQVRIRALIELDTSHIVYSGEERKEMSPSLLAFFTLSDLCIARPFKKERTRSLMSA